MTTRERLHEFLVDVMVALGHPPAVFIGQDQRLAQDQFDPVIVYSSEGGEVIETFDSFLPLTDTYMVQIASRRPTAADDVDGILTMIRSRIGVSEDADVVRTEGDRDDDLGMVFNTVEVSVSTDPSEHPIHRSTTEGSRLLFGAPDARKRLIYGGKALVW